MSAEEFGVYKYVSLANDANKLTFGNLVWGFLFDDVVSQNKLYNYNLSEGQVNKYIHKGFLFLCLMIQLLLKYMSLPMKKLGFMLEHFLNGNEVPGTVGYYSFVGQFDKRLDLDKNIKHEDGRYNAVLSMMASKIAYENEVVIQNAVSQHWKMEFVKFYNFYNEFQEKYTTQAFIFQDRNTTNNNNMVYVCFRGTSPFTADDWSTDFDISWCKIKGLGKLHMGFTLALGLKKYYPYNNFINTNTNTNTNTKYNCSLNDYFGYWPKEIEQDEKYPLAYYTIREKLKDMLANNPSSKFIVTGHSLGGALAILFPAILTLHEEWELLDRMEGVYTYGQPRAGDKKFSQVMSRKLKEHGVKYYRIVYANDIVPTVPLDHLMMFKHFGKCIHFNSLYHAKVVKEEWSIKKMKEGPLSLIKWMIMTIIHFILARLNAVWELIRGFLIGFVEGPDYKEGWLTIAARIFGSIFPGAIEHLPRDYVNATRLTSPDIFLNYISELSQSDVV